jgi:hypothetical protein
MCLESAPTGGHAALVDFCDVDVIRYTNVQEDSRITVTEAGDGRLELAITNIGPKDAGDYQCSVSNSVGQNSSTAKLTVQC